MMADRYNHRGLPSNLIHYDCEYIGVLSVEEGVNFKSVPTLFIGNVTDRVLVTPNPGCRLKLKSIVILCEGGVGKVKIYRSSDNSVILPMYLESNKTSNTSSSFNMILEPDEYIYVTTDGVQAGSEVFIGITYIGLNGDY